MSHRKFGLKALGLCLVAALGIMAFAAVSAQATEWLESGAKVTVAKTAIGKKDEKATKDWTFDTTINLLGTFTILCNELVVKNGVLNPDGTGKGDLEFKGDCLAAIAGKAAPECNPAEPIIAKVKVEQYLHEKEHYFLFSPENGTLVFTTVSFPKTCAIGEKVEILGHAIIKDCEKAALVDQKARLIEQVQGKAFDLEGHKNSLAFGKNAATLLGSEIIELASGNTWAGHV